MIFFLFVVGAVIGFVLDSEGALGFWAGGAIAALVVKLWQLGRRLSAAEKELARWRPAGLEPATPREEPEPVDPFPVDPALDPVPVDRVAVDPSPVDPDEIDPAAFDRELAFEDEPELADETFLSDDETPPSVHEAAARTRPSTIDRALGASKSWFADGNVPVKIGVLVLFAGVAAALRFAAVEGYLRVPIGMRLSLIAAAALAALGLGWRERRRRPVFALNLQGGAIGVLLLTIFAAFRLYRLLPAEGAFGLVVLLVMGAAFLAVLQQTMMLAVLGFLGGYLAPVLLSAGTDDHVALFSFYAVLNAAVLAISWRQRWRLLNLIGFAFTFGVGSWWFSGAYRPEMFWSVEPFLVIFFLFYVMIGLLYFIRPAPPGEEGHSRRWVDGTLVFGTPLVAFPMQAVLLGEDRLALAFSAVAVAAVYLGLLLWLRRHRDERLLTESYAALALGFATLAVPLAFSAATTASLWALEGAALAWLGLRQKRTLPWLAGLAMQPIAAVAYLAGELERRGVAELPLLNGTWLGAAFLAFSGLALALLHDRHKPMRVLPALLMLWGLGWWLLAGFAQIDVVHQYFGADEAVWHAAMLYLAFTVLAAGLLRLRLAWPRASWGVALPAVLALPMIVAADWVFRHALTAEALASWFAYAAALLIALWLHRDGTRHGASRSVALAHVAGLWALALALTVDLGSRLGVALGGLGGLGGPGGPDAASGWRFLATVAPVGLLTLGLWRRERRLAWPRAEAFASYRWLFFAPALLYLGLHGLRGLVDAGGAEPLTYLPLLNPLEIALLGVAFLLWGFCRERLPRAGSAWPLWALGALALVTSAILRAVHHGRGEPWSMAILDSDVAQTSLTIVWSLLGVLAWVVGSRWRRRALWQVGAGLMAVVLLKLLVVDRQFMGNIPGIVSFLSVGLLLVVIGYFAPSPPEDSESQEIKESTDA